MIEHTTIDGLPAQIQYLDADLQPTSKGIHDIEFIRFDTGGVRYVCASPEPHVQHVVSQLQSIA